MTGVLGFLSKFVGPLALSGFIAFLMNKCAQACPWKAMSVAPKPAHIRTIVRALQLKDDRYWSN